LRNISLRRSPGKRCVPLLAILSALNASPAVTVAVVHDYAGSPVGSAKARLLSVDRVLKAAARPDGALIFDRLVPGTYDLQVSAPGFQTAVYREMSISESPSGPLDIVLKVASQPDHCGYENASDYAANSPGVPMLSGHIQDVHSSKGIVGARVDLTDAETGRQQGTALSDRNGNFTFAVMPAGIYSVEVSKHGYYPIQLKSFFAPRENPTTLGLGLDKRGHLDICQ
jgi:hypothetical protein